MNTTAPTSIAAPKVIQNLIYSDNKLLQNYKDELTAQVVTANLEVMTLLGLNPNDGWRLDTDAMAYVKDVPSEKPQSE